LLTQPCIQWGELPSQADLLQGCVFGFWWAQAASEDPPVSQRTQLFKRRKIAILAATTIPLEVAGSIATVDRIRRIAVANAMISSLHHGGAKQCVYQGLPHTLVCTSPFHVNPLFSFRPLAGVEGQQWWQAARVTQSANFRSYSTHESVGRSSGPPAVLLDGKSIVAVVSATA